jgi:putative oxidoreductase
MNSNNQIQTAAMLLRVGLGSMWIAHALLKGLVFTIPGFASWLESQGVPTFMAWPFFLVELIGGILIFAGFYGRYVSAALIPLLFCAMWVHIGNGWVHTSPGGGWEYPLFLILASIVHILLGDGRFSMNKYQTLISHNFSRNQTITS